MNRQKLKGRVAIISGGGSGIGKATAFLFAQEGARVVIVDIDDKNGEKVAQAIKAKSGEAVFIKTDVSKGVQVQALVKKVLEDYGQIDILFNNAAIEKIGKITDLSEEEWDRVIEVNLKSVFLCSKYVITAMIQDKGGVIINNSSGLGLTGGQDVAAYAASKGAIITLTKCLARDYASKNIRVNCICPDAIDTPLLRRFTTEEELKAIVRDSILKRLGTAEEAAKVVLFLASDACPMMTGSIINVGLIN